MSYRIVPNRITIGTFPEIVPLHDKLRYVAYGVKGQPLGLSSDPGERVGAATGPMVGYEILNVLNFVTPQEAKDAVQKTAQAYDSFQRDVTNNPNVSDPTFKTAWAQKYAEVSAYCKENADVYWTALAVWNKTKDYLDELKSYWAPWYAKATATAQNPQGDKPSAPMPDIKDPKKENGDTTFFTPGVVVGLTLAGVAVVAGGVWYAKRQFGLAKRVAFGG